MLFRQNGRTTQNMVGQLSKMVRKCHMSDCYFTLCMYMYCTSKELHVVYMYTREHDFSLICPCTCTCMYMCMYVHVHVCACIFSEHYSSSLFSCSLSFFFLRSLPQGLKTREYTLSGSRAN